MAKSLELIVAFQGFNLSKNRESTINLAEYQERQNCFLPLFTDSKVFLIPILFILNEIMMELNPNSNWAGLLADSLIQEMTTLANNYSRAISERRLIDARCIQIHKECILIELKAVTAHRRALRESN